MDKIYLEQLKEASFWKKQNKKLDKQKNIKKDAIGRVPKFIKSKCRGYGECLEVCPVDAVSGDAKKRNIKIDAKQCIKCGACIDSCKAKAIV